MKTTTATALAILLLGSAAASSLSAQGHFQWGNSISRIVRAPIYGLDPMHPTQSRSGNTAAGMPAGTQTYGGVPIEGPGYTAAIYTGDTAAQVMASITHVQLDTFRSGPNAGLTTSQVTSDPNRPPGTANVHYQLRVWDNQGGTITCWAQVMAAGGSIPCGVSDVLVFSTPLSVGPLGPPNTGGIRSFQLTAVPEPSLVALGVLGFGTLFFRRRK